MNTKDIVSVLRRHARQRPDHVAVRLAHYQGRELMLDEITYRELDERARGRAAWIREHADETDPVLIVLPHGRDLVLTVIACLYARVVLSVCPMPSGRSTESERLGQIIVGSGARLLLTDEDSISLIRGEIDRLGLAAQVRVGQEADPSYEPAPVRAGDIAVLQYTSGSISSPRGVAVHHGGLIDNLTTIENAYGATPADGYCGWLPLYHDMGLIGQLLCALHTGGTTTMMTPMDFLRRPGRWLQLTDRFRAGYSGAPNFGLDFCVKALRDSDLDGLDLSCWKVILNGAEPINPAIARGFTDRLAGVGLRPEALKASYGLAETTLFVCGTPLGQRIRTRVVDEESLRSHQLVETTGGATTELVSCGVAPTLEVAIVDPGTLHRVPEDRVGEIWVRGPSVAAGYWAEQNGPGSEFCSYTSDGAGPYLRTGDLGAHQGGELFVTGRVKDLVVINGRNFYPTDVEIMIPQLHDAVRDQTGAFFSVTTGSEEAVLVQEINTSALGGCPLGDLSDLIKNHVTRRLGISVGTIVLARPGTVPRTTSGKIRRLAVADQLRAGSLPVLHEDLSRAFEARYRSGSGTTGRPALDESP